MNTTNAAVEPAAENITNGLVEMTLRVPAFLSQDEIKLMLAIKLFEAGKVSLGKATQVSGLTKRDFIDVLGQNGIPVINYSADELKRELALLRP